MKGAERPQAAISNPGLGRAGGSYEKFQLLVSFDPKTLRNLSTDPIFQCHCEFRLTYNSKAEWLHQNRI